MDAWAHVGGSGRVDGDGDAERGNQNNKTVVAVVWRGDSCRGLEGLPDLEGACRVSRPNWQQHVCVIRAQTTAHGDLSRQTGRPSNARADRRQHAVRDVAANEY